VKKFLKVKKRRSGRPAGWIGYLSTNAPKTKVLPLLIEYAQAHPKSDAGIELFRSYAVKLESKRDRTGAIECYRTAIDLYAQHPKVRSLQQRLRKLEGGNRNAARKAPGKSYPQAKMERTIRRLGNRTDGYFVIYAAENVKPPRHGGMYFYSDQYEVLAGRDYAAAYIDGLDETWSWKLVKRFPQTHQGREQAYDLWKKRLREKRTGRKTDSEDLAGATR